MPKIPSDSERKISNKFKERLLELVDEQELSKKDFASKVNVSASVITRAMIYGIIPSLRPLIKIADYFEISLPYLLGDTDNDYFCKSDGNETFHIRLKDLAKTKNVKYSEIAHSMPFTKNYFYEWERNEILPSLEYLEALGYYFDVSIDYLLGRTDDKN